MNTSKKKQEQKANLFTKIALKRTIKNFRKKIEKALQKKKENEKEKERQKIIKAIWSMTDILTIYDDDAGKIPLTLQILQNKTIEQLINLLEEILDEAEKLVK